jgi:hypothetical protein
MLRQMNERIRELTDQIWAEEYWDNPNTDKLLPAQLEKFAELIVQECMKVAVFKDADTNVAGYMAIYRLQGRSTAAQMIKEHFGVEE